MRKKQPNPTPGPPVPNNCTFWSVLKSGITVTTKRGFALELGLIGFDASLNTDSETKQEKIEASFSLLRGKLSAERSINPGILVPDNVDPNTEFSVSAGPFKKNLVTGNVGYSPSTNAFKLGGALFFGKDISFDPATVEDKIAVCKGQ